MTYNDPRLHHPDGTHRATARSAKGSEVTWFEAHAMQHLESHATGAILASLALAPRDEHGEVEGEGW